MRLCAIFPFLLAGQKTEHKTQHVNNHKNPVPGCKKNNYDFCLNGGKCATGGICTCTKTYTGLRCEETICEASKALSKKTGKCIDVDQFIMTADTFSIPWKRTLANSGHDDFISASDYLEKTVTALMEATLNTFIEAKVIQFKQISQGVNFKVRIRVMAGKSTTDPILWYRWIKRAIDFSTIEAGHSVYIKPESLEVFDEDECKEELDRCSSGSNCVNQLGSYQCICNTGLVDWAAANGDRPGIDCRDPCNNGTTWCLNKGQCVNALNSLTPLCICPMGFSGPQCQTAAESMVVLMSLWGIAMLIIFAFTGICIYKCIAKRRHFKMYHISSDSKQNTIAN